MLKPAHTMLDIQWQFLPFTVFFWAQECARAATFHLCPFSSSTGAAGAPQPTVPASLLWPVQTDAAAAARPTPGQCRWFSAAPKAGSHSRRWWWSSPAASPPATSPQSRPPGASCPGFEDCACTTNKKDGQVLSVKRVIGQEWAAQITMWQVRGAVDWIMEIWQSGFETCHVTIAVENSGSRCARWHLKACTIRFRQQSVPRIKNKTSFTFCPILFNCYQLQILRFWLRCKKYVGMCSSVSAKLCLTHKPKHKNHFGSPQLYGAL